MDLIVASSRGKNIGHHLINPNLSIPIKTYYKSSASITSLATMASQIILQYNKHPTQKVHVYFLAGLPDITSFERSSDGMYQEVVIWETAEEGSLRVIQTIREAEATVKELGAIPIFCTVAPMSLKTWNSKRLQQHKTTHLKHSQHYFGPSQDNPHYTYNMQITLGNAVTHINQNIYSINHHNGMYTPKIAEFIFKSPQANRAPRMRYNKFVDGVHPDPLVTLCWAEEILGAIIHNRHNYTK